MQQQLCNMQTDTLYSTETAWQSVSTSMVLGMYTQCLKLFTVPRPSVC